MGGIRRFSIVAGIGLLALGWAALGAVQPFVFSAPDYRGLGAVGEGLVLYYPFSETSGTRYPWVGTGNFSDSGGVGSVGDPPVALFDGVNDYLSRASYSLGDASDWTMCALAYVLGTANAQFWGGAGYGMRDVVYSKWVTGTGLVWTFYNDASIGVVLTDTTMGYPAGGTFCVQGDSSRNVRLWHAGVSASYAMTNSAFVWQRVGTSSGLYYYGQMSRLGVWNRVLSEEELNVVAACVYPFTADGCVLPDLTATPTVTPVPTGTPTVTPTPSATPPVVTCVVSGTVEVSTGGEVDFNEGLWANVLMLAGVMGMLSVMIVRGR